MRQLISLAFFIYVVLALPTASFVHEKRDQALDEQHVIDRQRIDGDALLPMRIALQPNPQALSNAEAWLMEVSDPNSPKFGQHWTQEEVIQAFKPSYNTLSAVRAWLRSHGISKVTHSDNLQWLAFDLSASQAEKLLQTTFFEHQDAKGKFKASCDQYSLPESLSEHIDYVKPGVLPSDVTGRTRRSLQYLRTGGKVKPHIDPPTAKQNAPWPYQPSGSPTVLPSQPPFPFSQSSGSYVPTASAPRPTATHLKAPFPPDDLEYCYLSVSPACIRALYNFSIPDPSLAVSPKNKMGIFEEYDIGDLNEFWTHYTDIPWGTAPEYQPIDGAVTNPANLTGWRKNYTGGYGFKFLGIESTLDFELALPIIYPQNITVFQTDDPHWAAIGETLARDAGFLNTFLDALDGSYCTYSAFNETGDDPKLDPKYPDPRPHGYKGKLQCGVYKPTNVISISYDTLELLTPAYYIKRQCNEFLKLGLQGSSVFIASGDSGVAPCTRGPIGERIFIPNFPASCPWVTSVGATHIQRQASVYEPEAAVSGEYFASGGGFSIVFEKPAYQKEAVGEYLDNYVNESISYYRDGVWWAHNTTTGRYNRDGRGIPDISAVGNRIANWLNHEYFGSGGTSASTPIVAALFNRIIEERIRAGKGSLGFVNPTLYKNPDLLNDILKGHNGATCTQGFHCSPGWDPVTGLGTPKYAELLDVFMKLP